jgi:adenosylcobinamide-GDP ribazoletransferase
VAEALAEVRAAVSFLTRLPVVGSAVDVDRTGAAAFALVGAGIGLVAAIPVVILGSRLPLPAAVLALLLIVMVSGGLHLDGLGDTADALAAPTPEAAETARTDPRAGAAGVAAIALDLLLGVSLLAAVTAADPRIAAAALVVAVTASRAAAPLAARLWRVGRAGDESGGLGGWFATRVGSADVVGAVATTAMVTAIAAIVAGAGAWAMWLGAAGGAVAAAAIAAFIVGRRGTLDGDGYGAIVEVTFGCILGGAALGVPAT